MDNKTSQRQILKSTGIVGGSQIISIIVGVVRTKLAAIFLGPSGIGILGILQSTTDLVRNATGFGINFSGVKDIAEANSSADESRINTTITIIKKWALWTGLLGMIITLVLCYPLSKYSFGNNTYAISIAILSITLLITSISASQIALLQGLRKMELMAKATIYGSIVATLITVPLYWWLGIKGIVPGILLTTIGGGLVSWYFTKGLQFPIIQITFKETFRGGWSMAKLGFFIVITGFISTLTLYIARSFIANKLNLDAVGNFQASWTISKVYIGIVLNAMLADFYPRLSEINTDNKKSNKLINEQLEMALIVGIPMIVALCAFASIVVNLLYSSSFNSSIILLQWQMLGSFISLISWPIGVMFLSKGKGNYCIINDSIWSVTFLLCLYFGWYNWGFNVLGIAVLIASVVNLISTYSFAKLIGEFSFNKINLKYITIGTLAIGIVFLNIQFVNIKYQLFISSIILIITIVFSYNKLKEIIDFKNIFKGRF